MLFFSSWIFPSMFLDTLSFLLHTPLKQRIEIDFKKSLILYKLHNVGTHFTHKSVIHKFQACTFSSIVYVSNENLLLINLLQLQSVSTNTVLCCSVK